jgi:CIC family chloride channel protein
LVPSLPLETALENQAQRQRRLIIESTLLGVAGAFAAQLFLLTLRIAQGFFLSFLSQYRPPGLINDGGVPDEFIGRFGLWMIPVATTLGGLLVGFIVTRLAPETEGHGTDTAVRAFHRSDGTLRARVPPIKMIASALTIGSGGSAGREGPAALMAAGVGSWYASVMERDPDDRRLLLLIGMSAGLAAIFRSPIGTALFSIEVLYAEMEFESNALLYTMLASIVAYAVNGVFVGFAPLFNIPILSVLGVAAGLVAAMVPMVFYGVGGLFRSLKVRAEYKPAIGGFGVGLLAIAIPQVIGGGYGWMQQAIDGGVVAGTLLLLVFAKTLAMSLTVSSGGSGGVFAPSLFVGTMLGAFFAEIMHMAPAPFAIVGMAAVFAGAARVPIASLLMVTEMTGGYTLLVPAALAVMLSYVVQGRVSSGFKHRSLYQEQVPRPSESPAHHSEHLDIALRILEQRRLAQPLDSDHLQLLTLLRSGEAAEMAGDRRLLVGVLKPDSALIGSNGALQEGGKLDDDTQIVAIMRGEHMQVPRPDTKLAAGDRLILLTTPAGLEHLKDHVDRW